jgi:hypothetical protein
VLNLNYKTFNQRHKRSDTKVLRNAQRFIPANRYAQGEKKNHSIQKILKFEIEFNERKR